MTNDKRLEEIYRWCDQRCINQIYGFFKGCDPSIAVHEARIRKVLRLNSGAASDTDTPWIASMERTIKKLN